MGIITQGDKEKDLGGVAELPPLPAHETWMSIETAPKGPPVIVALISDGRVWRVSDAKFNRIGWYTVHGGQSCHWATHWIPMPPTGTKG